jgi:hypothetical protein
MATAAFRSLSMKGRASERKAKSSSAIARVARFLSAGPSARMANRPRIPGLASHGTMAPAGGYKGVARGGACRGYNRRYSIDRRQSVFGNGWRRAISRTIFYRAQRPRWVKRRVCPPHAPSGVRLCRTNPRHTCPAAGASRNGARRPWVSVCMPSWWPGRGDSPVRKSC